MISLLNSGIAIEIFKKEERGFNRDLVIYFEYTNQNREILYLHRDAFFSTTRISEVERGCDILGV